MKIETIEAKLLELEAKIGGCMSGGEVYQLMNKIEMLERNIERLNK